MEDPSSQEFAATICFVVYLTVLNAFSRHRNGYTI